MPDMDVMRELTREFPGPAFDELVAVSRRRRRRAAAAAAGAVAMVVLAVGAVAVALPDGTDSLEPAPQPSSPTSTLAVDPKLERIRAEGSVAGQEFTPDGSLWATKYVVCRGCNGDGPGVTRTAIEVKQGDASALFEGQGRDARLVLLDDHTVLVQDVASEDAPVRYRLLRADGTEQELQWVDDPAPAVPGPGIFVDNFDSWRDGMIGPQSLAVVDEESATVRPVAAPDDVNFWGPNTDEALWGVTYDCRVRWAVDGSFRESYAGCSHPDVYSYVDAGMFPAGWLDPGRMVVAEPRNRSRVLLHVTLDGGETWQQYPVRDYRFVTAALRDIG